MLQRDRQRQRERGTAGGGGAGAFTAEYLVIAGGGGGASAYGGGGAGGYRTAADFSIALGSPYTVTVGAGAPADPAGGPLGSQGGDGGDSTFDAITSTGGGGGSSYDAATPGPLADGRDGGSGGGGGYTPAGSSGGSGNTPAVTPSQGNDGGGGSQSAPYYGAGGGGGAGAVGANGTSTNGGAGGAGLESYITGSSVYRAGGGGGGNYSVNNGGAGGIGGGGNAGSAGVAGAAGAANTGGGGGGGHAGSAGVGAWTGGGAGGSGVVIIRVPSTVVAEFSAGVVYNYIPLDDFNVYEITAAGVSDTVTFSQGAVTTVGESLRFNDDDSAYLSRTPSVDGDRTTWTWSAWVKLGNLGIRRVLFGTSNIAGNDYVDLEILDTNNLMINSNNGSASVQIDLKTNALFRDPSAWYHVLLSLDTSQAVSANRVKIYINGVQQTSFSTATYPPLNYNSRVNTTNSHTIGSFVPSSTRYFDGYMSDVYLIDGQALDPSRFGKQDADGIWQPISYTGSYGTNGFHLDFADNSTAAALGTDTSGNGNDWTPSGITTADQVTDTPSVNYCTLNPLNKLIVVGAGASPTFSDGNLNVNGNNQDAVGTFGVSSGKWYYEVTQQDSGAFTNGVGWYREGTSEESIYRDDGNFRFDGTEAAYGASWQSSGDIIGIALDLDNTTISFYKNGVSQGNAKTNLSAGTYIPLIYCRLPSNLTANFGQSAFTYTPPTGFQALNSSNLPAPTITDGKAHFQPLLYTGNGTTQAIGGLEFQPDFVWIKNRSGVNNHILSDAIRGAGVGLASDVTNAEFSIPTDFQSFDASGFTVGYAGFNFTNGSGINYVAWNWNAGGTTVTNTDGTITSQVRANTDAGISIVSYTGNATSGATIGHGLATEPDMLIFKNRSGTDGWIVFHREVGGVDDWWDTRLLLASTAARAGSAGYLTASPTSTLLTLSGTTPVNGSGSAYIAYCFAGVDGFSKFGSYTGNGSADGPFIYTGFRPAFVMVKRTDSTGSWFILDGKRSPYNDVDDYLYPNLANAELVNTTADVDFLSNGFKQRTTATDANASGGTYIFVAFAENPFKTARAR